MGKCDDGYTAMTLQFATREDIKVMESPGARLITAAADGDKKAVKEHLADGIDVNSQDWDNLTALIAASSAGECSRVHGRVRARVRICALCLYAHVRGCNT